MLILGGAACIVAPVSVAINAPAGVRLFSILALFATAPGTAVLPSAAERTEVGLVIGTSLSTVTLISQAMISFDAWEPTLLVYGMSLACMPPIGFRLRRGLWPRA